MYADGDTGAFDELFRRYESRAFAFFVRRTRSRERAQDLNRRRAQGEIPSSFREVPDDDDRTFGAIALRYIDEHEPGWKNAKHRQQWRNTLTTYAKPIWEMDVDQVDIEDLLQILRPIWLEKHETASRVRGRIEIILDTAKVMGLRSGENPARWRGNLALLLPKARKGPKRHHPAMPYCEVPALMERLRSQEGLAAKALQLLIHTATRTSEVLDATWNEFDLEAKVWTIPASRMKAGREHRVPLTKPVIALLDQLPRQCELVFPGGRAGKPLSNMSMNQLLRRMQVQGVTVHGFRSSFRDYAADVVQAPREIAEAALAHQVGSEVERAYRRGDALEQRRELMSEWSEFLAKPL